MVTAFENQVYELCRKVPKGKVTTYKEIAHALGTGAYRAVGQALRKNPNAPKTPCHRVIASNRTIGGFFGQRSGEGIVRKIQLLKKEGVVARDGKFDKKFVHVF